MESGNQWVRSGSKPFATDETRIKPIRNAEFEVRNEDKTRRAIALEQMTRPIRFEFYAAFRIGFIRVSSVFIRG